ncbi:MAG: 1-deoxy-D-xylulose-5-phosphate synthase [Candidatus Omnitrophica bacterium]|nr:1-deoxy-D-xylulose-5-phosphate synthase [Candidatus Omnitrophota bacterium]MBU1924132.1 1-deoxy-D-xylulose-5-phosphate synthase [Candidatus Omnitrophota bacterium]
MRAELIRTLIELADKDERIILLTGDLGYSVLEPFCERFPKRFFNVGVAEQNMVGIATGLAEAGFIPFVYSIATFASLRPYEFIRNGPILHALPVRIVGIGDGFDYGPAGPTHYSLEDVGVMRIQPGITVIAPADYQQARTSILATWNLPGPVYYRMGKDDKFVASGLEGRFELAKAQTVRNGSDLLIVSMGSILKEAFIAAEFLAKHKISSRIDVIASISPAPIADLVEALRNFSWVFTLEAHYVTGGIGSLLAEIIAEHGLKCRLIRCGVKDLFDGLSGSQAFMYRKCGISGDILAGKMLAAMQGSKRRRKVEGVSGE